MAKKVKYFDVEWNECPVQDSIYAVELEYNANDRLVKSITYTFDSANRAVVKGIRSI